MMLVRPPRRLTLWGVMASTSMPSRARTSSATSRATISRVSPTSLVMASRIWAASEM